MFYIKLVLLWALCLGFAQTGMLDERIPALTCDVPQPPRDGYVEVNNRTVGSTVRVMCKAGYFRIGNPPFTKTCQLDGHWSDVDMECLAQSCGDPGTPRNGRRLGLQFNYLNTVQFTCNKGYVLHGPSSRRCQYNQTWSLTQPFCRPLSCGDPPKVQYAVPLVYGYSMAYVYGNRILYKCLSGFKRNGNELITCRVDGKWHGKLPQCTEILCPKLASPSNGRLIAGRKYYKEGGRVRYQCYAGYMLFGPHVRTCLKSGEWAGPESICFKCAEVGTGVFIRKPYNFKPGVVLSKSGYKVIVQYTDDGEEEDVVLLGRGTQHYIIVEDRIPSTDEIFIGTRVLALNARLGSFIFATVLVVNDSYFGVRYDGKLNEQGMVTLRDIRTLEPPRFCATCSDPGRPPHSSREDDLTEFITGMKVIFTCQYTYKMNGSETRRCLSNGTWTGSTPSCTVYSCDELDAFPPKNGKRVGDNFMVGSTVQFTCNDGFSLIGQKQLKCLPSGRWSDVPPSCPSVCQNYRCASPGEKCVYDKSVGRRCICRQNVDCPAFYEPVCGTDGLSYNSQCILSAIACRSGRNIRVVKRGRCLPGGLCQVVPFSVCRASFPRFFFNATSKKCQFFIAGGCHASGWNGFFTEKQCNQNCLVDICKQPAYPGPCTNVQKRWYFDSSSGKCQRFSYGGCYGNENIFATKHLCRQRCQPIKKVSGFQCPLCPHVKHLRQACKESTLVVLGKVRSMLPSDGQKRLLRYVIDIQHVIKNTTQRVPEGIVIISVPFHSSKSCACPRIPLKKRFILIGRASMNSSPSKTGFIVSPDTFVAAWSLDVRKQIKLKCTSHVIIPNNIR